MSRRFGPCFATPISTAIFKQPRIWAILLVSLAISFSSELAAQQKVTVHATPHAVKSGAAKLVGPFNPQQMLRLVVALRPPHMAEEEQFLRELQDPASPQFHQFLSEKEWDARFAPSAQDEEALVQWAQSQGLNVTERYPNRLLVIVTAPVATIEKAFDVSINAYQKGSQSYFSNDRDPSIPASLQPVVQAVLGMNSFEVMHSASGKDPVFPIFSPGPENSLGKHFQSDGDPKALAAATASGKKSGRYDQYQPYDPATIYTSYAYNYVALQNLGHCCNPLNNPGNSPKETSIAIVIAGDYSDFDFSGFLNQYPYLASNVQRHFVGGMPQCCDGEATLDLEWSTAMANSFGSSANTAEIHMYETANNYGSSYLHAIEAALNGGVARVLSMSWGGAELYVNTDYTMDSFHAVFNQMLGEGWSLVAAAGDGGSTANCQNVSLSHPASDPDVTSVGGTSLATSQSQYFSETTWSWSPGQYVCTDNDGGTGGGCSVYFSDPGYQGVTACAGQMRSMPDISLNSDWVNQPQWFFFESGPKPTGGTSIAAPEVAGFYAQENAYLLYLQSLVGNTCGASLNAPCAPVGSANPFFYQEGIHHTSPHNPFYDITQGCNSNDITQMPPGLPYFCAGQYYDRVTGWGSANMLQLAWMINFNLAGDARGPTAAISGPPVNRWYNTDQTVSWTLTDNSGNGHLPNGVAGWTAAWDVAPGDPYSEPSPGAGSNYYGLQSYGTSGMLNGLVQLSQGCHNAYVRSWDNAGNSAMSAYGPLCLDTVPPQTTVNLSGNQQNGNYTGPVLVSLSATDNGSGVASTSYVIDSGSFVPYTGPVYVWMPGFHQVSAYSVDNVGNLESTEYTSFNIQSNQQFTVTVSNRGGTGNGTVTSSDGQINCGSTCNGSYYDEQPLTLTAAPARGSVFIGWRNCDVSNGLSCTATITAARTITAVFNLPVALQFVPLTPCRVVDTRGPNGQFGGPPLQGGSERDFPIPSGLCPNIPSNAAAYSLNITAVPHQHLSYLTTWPTGLTQPNISTLNSYDGRAKANAAIVPAGDNASISVYATDTTDLIVDINGYFVPADSSTLAFFALPPCRVVDTRGPNGQLGGPYLHNQQTRDFPVLQATACNIPSTAQAYSMNFTALPHNGPLGYLTVWPHGQNMPMVSTLNAYTGAVTANAAIVPAGTNGDIDVYAYGNDTDLLIDIDGYFAPSTSGALSLYAFAPCRLLDTRGAGGPFSGTLPVNVAGGSCQVPSNAAGYVMNATALPDPVLGYLTLWPDGQQQPLVSTLNAYDGAVTSNLAIVPTANGSIDAYASDLTQLILDISSYFAP